MSSSCGARAHRAPRHRPRLPGGPRRPGRRRSRSSGNPTVRLARVPEWLPVPRARRRARALRRAGIGEIARGRSSDNRTGTRAEMPHSKVRERSTLGVNTRTPHSCGGGNARGRTVSVTSPPHHGDTESYTAPHRGCSASSSFLTVYPRCGATDARSGAPLLGGASVVVERGNDLLRRGAAVGLQREH